MQVALLLAGFAMGIAATPHCAAMCGAPCAALTSGCRRDAAGFHLGRLIGYAGGGALAATSLSTLAAWTQATPTLQPIWTVLHLALLALGLRWLVTGQQPPVLRRGAAVSNVTIVTVASRRPKVVRSTAAGLAWVAWPCGALQAALLLAALADSPQGGAAVMGLFALGSMPGLALAPWLVARWHAWRGGSTAPAALATLGFRIAGAGLMVGSGWALTHGLWVRFAAWCAS